jgi:hypothetical protein
MTEIIDLNSELTRRNEKKITNIVNVDLVNNNIDDLIIFNLKRGIIKKYFSKTVGGVDVYPTDSAAYYFDIHGAILNACYKKYGSIKYREEYIKWINILEKYLGNNLAKINDHASCNSTFWIEKIKEIKNDIH